MAHYLVTGHRCDHVDNNWKFFRLMVGMALRHLNVSYDSSLDDTYITELDAFYLEDGWYQDGGTRRADHYVPFAFHFYGLILAALDGGEWTARYLDRAKLAVDDISRWFSDDGSALCFGRSLTYRFAIAGFFGATAIAGVDTMPWGQQKGFYLRILRWWAQQPFMSRDGILPIGYGYPNLIMSEPYNSAQSPYWALKAFLPLMLPDTHPFWASDEEQCGNRPTPVVQQHIGFVVANPQGDAIALSSGQQTNPSNTAVRFAAEKYSKFAYSARYAFSVESDWNRFKHAVLDNMIGFSDDGLHYRVREGNEAAVVTSDGLLYGRWRPFSDVLVETFLYWEGDYHIRIHAIETGRKLSTIEGGFAIPLNGTMSLRGEDRCAVASTRKDESAVFDLSPSTIRIGRCHIAAPNTNLIAPRTVIPQLMTEVGEGENILAVAVRARPGQYIGTRSTPPMMQDLTALRRRLEVNGKLVTLMRSASA